MKILKVWWVKPSEIVFVLSRDCPFIPNVELKNTDIAVAGVERAPVEKIGQFSSYYIRDGFVHFMISTKSFPNVEPDLNYYLCGDFNGWGKAIGNEEWLMRKAEGQKHVLFELEVPLSKLNFKRGTCLFKFAAGNAWLEPDARATNVCCDASGNRNLQLSLSITGRHAFIVRTTQMCQLGEPVQLLLTDYNLRCDVDESVLLPKINTSAKLGAWLDGGRTVFSLFAPRADGVYVVYRKPGEKQERVLEAQTSDFAVWNARADEDLRGCLYSFYVDGKNLNATTAFDRRKSASDPYANAMVDSKGWCVVKYDSDLPVCDDGFKTPKWHDLVIVEAHLRDVLAQARAELTAQERLGFAGLTKWLKSPDCYLRKCGANCVELQPIQEFTYENKGDYEWGYMPVNWNSPASAYAADPLRATQNEEFAELVKAFHAAGLAVIIDVVYNHYGEPNFLELVDKQYYFRTDFGGRYSNYSGCGNDFRSESRAGLRLILDSLTKLVVNYGVDGFRFDLAELLGMEALLKIERQLKSIKPSIVLIAEPWSFRGHIAHALRTTGWASWNDGFRDFCTSYSKGWGNFDGFKYFMKASLGGVASFPAQTVNYVESHDDMCLFDKISNRYDNPSIDDIHRYKMAYALPLLSHGIPMLSEGFDLLRTKRGKNNTYKDGKANELDYLRAQGYRGLTQWLRALVNFRLSREGKVLRRDCRDDSSFYKFYKSDTEPAYAFMYNGCRCDEHCGSLFAAFNPSNSTAEFFVGEDLKGFRQIADIDNFDAGGLLCDDPCQGGILSLPRVSMAIFYAPAQR